MPCCIEEYDSGEGICCDTHWCVARLFLIYCGFTEQRDILSADWPVGHQLLA